MAAIEPPMTCIELPFVVLTVAQKLDLMERLWTDLSASQDAFDSPSWHGAVVEERMKAVDEGQAAYGDWAQAKERLRKQLP